MKYYFNICKTIYFEVCILCVTPWGTHLYHFVEPNYQFTRLKNRTGSFLCMLFINTKNNN